MKDIKDLIYEAVKLGAEVSFTKLPGSRNVGDECPHVQVNFLVRGQDQNLHTEFACTSWESNQYPQALCMRFEEAITALKAKTPGDFRKATYHFKTLADNARLSEENSELKHKNENIREMILEEIDPHVRAIACSIESRI